MSSTQLGRVLPNIDSGGQYWCRVGPTLSPIPRLGRTDQNMGRRNRSDGREQHLSGSAVIRSRELVACEGLKSGQYYTASS